MGWLDYLRQQRAQAPVSMIVPKNDPYGAGGDQNFYNNLYGKAPEGSYWEGDGTLSRLPTGADTTARSQYNPWGIDTSSQFTPEIVALMQHAIDNTIDHNPPAIQSWGSGAQQIANQGPLSYFAPFLSVLGKYLPQQQAQGYKTGGSVRLPPPEAMQIEMMDHACKCGKK